MKKLYLILCLLTFNIVLSQDYYVYVAAESDDQVSVLKFDGKEIIETDRVSVGIMPTENEGPHGITVDPNGKYWYLSLIDYMLPMKLCLKRWAGRPAQR